MLCPACMFVTIALSLCRNRVQHVADSRSLTRVHLGDQRGASLVTHQDPRGRTTPNGDSSRVLQERGQSSSLMLLCRKWCLVGSLLACSLGCPHQVSFLCLGAYCSRVTCREHGLRETARCCRSCIWWNPLLDCLAVERFLHVMVRKEFLDPMGVLRWPYVLERSLIFWWNLLVVLLLFTLHVVLWLKKCFSRVFFEVTQKCEGHDAHGWRNRPALDLIAYKLSVHRERLPPLLRIAFGRRCLLAIRQAVLSSRF